MSADRMSGATRRGRRMEKVSEVVAREIVHDIVDRDLQPGDMLPAEAVMLEDYDVGRASLREALRILEVQGLITIRPGPGGGPRVAGASSVDFGNMATLYFHVTRATFRDLVEARLVMDPIMARLAAERPDTEEVRRVLGPAVDGMGGALDQDGDDAYLRAASGFHAVIAGVSGNRVLDLYGRALRDVYFDRVSSMLFPRTQRQTVAKDHQAISKAIFDRQPDRAERLMREHMEGYVQYVEAQFPGLMDEVVDWR